MKLKFFEWLVIAFMLCSLTYIGMKDGKLAVALLTGGAFGLGTGLLAWVCIQTSATANFGYEFHNPKIMLLGFYFLGAVTASFKSWQALAGELTLCLVALAFICFEQRFPDRKAHILAFPVTVGFTVWICEVVKSLYLQ